MNTALKWALEHNFQSVAAQYSKTLALEVVRLREDNERLCSALQSSKKRAADYETTGLTPDEIAALKADRDAWRRRAEAAERDLLYLMNCDEMDGCDVCKKFKGLGMCDDCAPEWRGPKEDKP